MIKFSVFGGGSWATALVKILTDNKLLVNWYIRRPEQADAIQQTGTNPDYLNLVRLDTNYIQVSSHVADVATKSDVLLFAVPSAQLPGLLETIDINYVKDRVLVNAIKGTVGAQHESPITYISRYFNISDSQLAMLAGPCHAEEIGLRRKTYLTIGAASENVQQLLSPCFASDYVDIQLCDDTHGVTYAAIYKNVVGIVCGMAKGLRYGDNFLAVLAANALRELQEIVQSIGSTHAVLNSSYAGDLLVTAYSAHSRNRAFGELIGRGYSVEKAKRTMQMVAEGYGATQGLYPFANQQPTNFPILQTAYRVLFKHMPVATEFKLLEQKLH